MLCFITASLAQPATNVSYGEINSAPAMKWVCPEIEKYQSLLDSLQNSNYKIYANNVKDKFGLQSDPAQPKNKYIASQAIVTIDHPLYDTGNLLRHISAWVGKQKGWKAPDVDLNVQSIASIGSINVTQHAGFFNVNKVYISPVLDIRLGGRDKLIVSLAAAYYRNEEYTSTDNRHAATYNVKASEVYPFVPKSAYKNTYAEAYVETYRYFWTFISELCTDLNANFSKDTQLISHLHYEQTKDSLTARYGEPTKVISDPSTTPDVNKEIRFYEKTQKVIFMGRTIGFNDIISCEIQDDPQFIPGRTTTYDAGISFFGFGFGGSESSTTPSKVIHNYVVNVKLDNLATPFIRIATGQNGVKATEIASCFEYIMRHRPGRTAARNQKSEKKVMKKRR